VYSVSLWYNFGFLIISTALLGFGVAGVVLFLWKGLRERADVGTSAAWLSVLFSLSVVAAYWLEQRIPFDPFSMYTQKMQLLFMLATYIVVAVPFFFAGLILALLFTRFSWAVNRLYGFDLAGAAVGCIAIVFTMPLLGGGGSVLLAAAFSGLAVIVFADRKSRLLRAIALLDVMMSILVSCHAASWIPMRITPNKHLSSAVIKPVYTRWNTFSRVDLFLRKSRDFKSEIEPVIAIDQGTAATGLPYDMRPDVKSVLRRFSSDSLYNSCVAYLDRTAPDVLVVGSGAGQQVLDALHAGAGKITAVDINPIITSLVGENPYWADLFHQPQVRLFTDEGRNFIRSSRERYDAIVSCHTISNAAIASGALSLTENYMFTREAFEDYYQHLTDSGILLITRPEFQIPRLFTTARELMARNRVPDPALHLFAFTYPDQAFVKGRGSFHAVFMLSKSAFSPGQVERIRHYIYLPETDRPSILYNPFRRASNIYDSIVSTSDLPALYRDYPFSLEPATDNDPYFNHHTRWSSLSLGSFASLFSQNKKGRLALEDKPVAEVTLIILLVQAILIAGVFMLFPLWLFSRSELKTRNVARYLAYFSGLGCGFIMVEIVLIQQFSLLLGDPVYTFAIVLAAMLLFTGVGSYLSQKYRVGDRRLLQVAISALVVLIVSASFGLAPLLRTAVVLPMFARIVLCAVLMLPLGILIGVPFPSGIRIMGKEAPSLIPWAWGMNGFFTVIGSVLALMLSMMIGFREVLCMAAGIYLISMLVMLRATRSDGS